ncbi:RidA family protein [Mediterraneibacter agrestimuris]|uniref:RidA family protein n=1 Tax=Mediterraneibacter agrestimuris TaxID=2941333 RepID=UPI00203C15DF
MKEIINTTAAPAAIGPYVQAVKTGNTLFTSGQLGINPETGKLAEGVEAQAHASLTNLKNILAEAGMDFSNVVKTTVFVKDLADFAAVNAIYASYFGETFPARSCVQVAKLPMDGLVEIECIAIAE